MINTTSSFRISSVKAPEGGKTTFSIRDFNKDKPDEKNYARVCASNSVTLQNGDEVILDKISAASLGRFNGGLTVMLFAVVRISKPSDNKTESNPKPPTTDPATPPYATKRNEYDPVIDTSENETIFDTGPLLDISSDDLPF